MAEKILIYETNKYVLNSQQFEMIRSLNDSIFNGKTIQDEADKKRNNLSNSILECFLNAFKSEIFPLKSTQRKRIKRLAHKQMLQKFPIALAQLKAATHLKSIKFLIICIEQNKLLKE